MTSTRRPETQSRVWLSKALAGTGAGVVATIVCSPLDVAKTRVQVQSTVEGRVKYDGVFRSLRTIYVEEGIAGWYHGFTPAVCSVAVFWTCYFPWYDYAKGAIAEASGLPQSSSLVHMSAAAASGLLTDIITNPLWVVRTRLATQTLHQQQRLSAEAAAPTAGDGVSRGHRGTGSGAGTGRAPGVAGGTACSQCGDAATSSARPSSGAGASPAGAALEPQYRSMRHAFARIVAEEGPLSLFAGLSASILGLSHIMIQFPLYERIKGELSAREVARSTSAHHRSSSALVDEPSVEVGRTRRLAAQRTTGSPPQSAISHVIAASAISKLVASTITYPHEVIRARLQFDQGGRMYTGLLDATRKTIRSDGLAGLWLGFRLNIVRTIPQSVVTFTLYEYLSRSFQHALRLTSEAGSSTIARTRSENRA